MRHSEIILADWPQPCNGGCGRLLRPPKSHASDYPGVRTRNSQRVLDPWCQVCTERRNGRQQGHRRNYSLGIESEEVRLARMRSELGAMIAGRRRRGVPPEGTILPGDTKMNTVQQRPFPGAPTVKLPTVRNLCVRGHEFTGIDAAGRRWCAKCAEVREALKAERGRTREGGSMPRGSQTCRQGHLYTHFSGDRKYCPTCKAESRKRSALAKARMNRAAA